MSLQTYDIRKIKRCQDAYNNGIKQRKSIPFVSGSLYKIKEVQGQFSGYKQEVLNIGKCANGDRNAGYKLRHCTSEDKAYWVRHHAKQMCFDLGRDLAGTLYALKDDGVSQQKIDRLQIQVQGGVYRLIKMAEIARIDAKTNWPQLSKQLALGEGSMYDFIAKASDFVDAVVREIEK